MISLGRNIIAPGDPLIKVPVESVYHAILNPKAETAGLIRQLRIIRSIDPKQYALLKRKLPYLVCGMFNPTVRKIDNFAYTEYFILDIDHLSDKQLSLQHVRENIKQDSRVVLCFASPSEDGLKVMFKLKDRCFDAGVFSLFYKLFAQQFAKQYGIEQAIDMKTCDVSRACFVSMDSEAYYNAGAERVDVKAFVDTDSVYDFFDLAHVLEQEAKEQKKAAVAPSADAAAKPDVSNEVMVNIKAVLNPSVRRRAERPPAYVPQQLESVIGELKAYIVQTGVAVTEIVSIQYGKKIRCQAGMKMAETNVFYGKRGYSVVMSPRSGTNAEFNEMVAELIKSFFQL